MCNCAFMHLHSYISRLIQILVSDGLYSIMYLKKDLVKLECEPSDHNLMTQVVLQQCSKIFVFLPEAKEGIV